MKAICKHELRGYFHSMTAYIFCAFILCFVGVGAMLYNIQAAVANFEYVLDFVCIGLVVIVPVLTMRTLAEEKKQKTDQLLYALPLKTSDIILGKFLAVCAVFALPVAVIALYPLIFAQFGEVYLLTSYGSLLAFLLLGGALISVGMFISSLTENQGFASGIGIAVLLVNYFSVTLAESVPANAIGSMAAICLLIVLLGLLVRFLTKNDDVAFWLSLGLIVLTGVTYYFKTDSFEGLLPAVMKKLSLFDRFTTFVNGSFDMTAIVFYLTVIALFLFLTMQSLEKRRYN